MKSNTAKQLIKLLKGTDLSYNAEGKAEFKKLSLTYLEEIGQALDLKVKEIWFNPGGIAVSGEATLMGMRDDNAGIYIEISQGLHLPLMYRTIKHMKDYTGGNNNWVSFYEMDDVNYIVNQINRLLGGNKNGNE